MREIKFRGYNSYSKEWKYGFLINDYKEGDFHIALDLYHVDGAEYNVEAYQVVPESVGQFIGLLDKNGKEIYEGDIVNAWDWGTPPHKLLTISKVEWDSDEKGWGLFPDPTDGDRYDLFRNLEVIGNIYENPDLLK